MILNQCFVHRAHISKSKRSNTLIGVLLTSLAYVLLPTSLSAHEITAAVGTSLAPYIIQEDNSGIEIDIVKEALALKNHTLRLRYPPLKQVPILYKKNAVDAALTVTKDFGLDACLSDVVIQYQNFAISLTKSNFTIKDLSDLANKKIVAFQNATTYLGDAYKIAVSAAQYTEIAKQTLQVNRLFLERDDIVIADKNIFLYYKSKTTHIKTDKPLTFHPIFPPSPYRVAFRDQKVCQDFNEGLKILKETGKTKEIMARYLNDTSAANRSTNKPL